MSGNFPNTLFDIVLARRPEVNRSEAMSVTVARETSSNLYLRAGAAALAILVLTSVHHIYGAAIYQTPWRMHIVYIAAPIGLAIALTYSIGWSWLGSTAGRVATWAGSLIALAFPVAAIGFYEGGYNHVLKNFIYFGFGEDAARTLFSGETYEMPDNFIFEATGVAQLPLAVLTTVLVLKLLRSIR
jgi:hypothetical protein